ncbi:MAG: Crp/Fnr family transcriptional regulator [Anaerovoracaceae bacterium]|jgi:CRP-like cAMP-binding protein
MKKETARRSRLKDADLEVIQKSEIFKGIDKSELEALLPCLLEQKRRYQKGESIFRTGDRIIKIGLLLAGTAHIERYDYWGNRHIVTALRPGDIFGESYAASPGSIMNVSVAADEDLSVLFLDLSKALHMCTSACPFHARLIDNLVSLLAGRNLMLNEKLTYVTQHTLRDKILSYLSAESVRQHSSYFDIPFDRQQMADYLNAERSALSNELSKLRADGIIDFQKNHFRLVTPIREE